MKAFVLRQAGRVPAVDTFEEPTVGEGDQQVVKVEAAGLNPYDRYMTTVEDSPVPRVVGIEGVGLLDNGKRVYIESSVSPYGTVAEKSLAKLSQTIEIPDELKAGPALAIGIAGLAGWLPLSWKTRLKPGESVLILGATGVQGQIAVQAAKLLGAGHVVAAGRDKSVLESLRSKGADEIAILEGDIAKALKAAAPKDGYHVVVDSLFGQPFTALLDSDTLGVESRVAVLGGGAGQQVELGFRQLQANKGATIAGYSTFFVPHEIKQATYLKMAEHIIAGDIQIDVKEFSLDQAGDAWQAQADGPHSKVIVVPA